MKGITHFATGVAAATFFGEAVRMATEQQSFILLLGGVFGILPDTLDFKFGRYFDKPDYEIDPDPDDPDPKMIAKKLAEAANEAYQTGKPVEVQLHTIKLSAYTWRRYAVMFDTNTNNVVVEIGPIVSTSQVPYPGTEPQDEKKRRAKAKIKAKLSQELQKPSIIDIMSGPSFKFERKGDVLEVKFLPWHRQWSHSFTVGALLALLVGIIFGKLAGVISFVAFALHIIEDLFGFMGGNLIYPITRDRTRGAKLIKASSPLGNFLVVYASIVIIIFNLNRFSANPVITIPWYLYFFIMFVIPAGILYLISGFFRIKDITGREEMTARMMEEMDEINEEYM
ncbi:MAG: hypothetical protein DRO92_04665, partial [Candidatus Altiarchaeales archaeon]